MMMLAGTVDVTRTTSEVFAIALVVAGVIVALTTVVSRRGQTLATSQDMTIASLQGTVTSLEADNRLKDERIAEKDERIVDLTSQLTASRAQTRFILERVTQVAKVDELREDLAAAHQRIDTHHDAVLGKLRELTTAAEEIRAALTAAE